MDRKTLGNFGENKSAEYLKHHGYKIIDRNYRCRYGEIDIIARKDRYIIFVEVKLRKNSNFAQAREFVDYYKQKRLISTALLWLSANNCDLQPRFDIIEIYAPYGIMSEKIELNLIEDAFE